MQGVARVEEVVVLDELNAQPLAALHEGAEIVLSTDHVSEARLGVEDPIPTGALPESDA
jgi:hypothetical protein